MNLEHTTVSCQVKAIGEPDVANPGGTFEMYAATFGNVDRGGDVIEPGAFKNLPEFLSDGWIALNHRSGDLPIGYPIDAVQDSKGLLIRGGFHTTPDGQAARLVIRERFAAGKSVKASIGYMVEDASYETRGGQQVRSLKAIDIFEASFVNLPMNPRADVVAAKALDRHEREYLEVLESLDVETKKGRQISAANHAALMDHAERMDGAMKAVKSAQKAAMAAIGDFKAFLDARKPADPDADGDDDSAGGDDPDDDAKKALVQLRRRALAARLMTPRP